MTTLSFPLKVKIDPIQSTLTKNEDGTWNVQLKIDGKLSSKSWETLDVSEEELHSLIQSGKVTLSLTNL